MVAHYGASEVMEVVRIMDALDQIMKVGAVGAFLGVEGAFLVGVVRGAFLVRGAHLMAAAEGGPSQTQAQRGNLPASLDFRDPRNEVDVVDGPILQK